MHRKDYYRYSHKSSVNQHKLKFDNIISYRRQYKRKDQSIHNGGKPKRIKYDFDDYNNEQEQEQGNVMCKTMFLIYMLMWGVPIYYTAITVF